MNDGPRPITLIQAQVDLTSRWPHRRCYARVDYDPAAGWHLPARLEEGERVQMFFPSRRISDILNEQDVRGKVAIRGFYTDSDGRHHTAKTTAQAAVLRAFR
jgi:hypothetical protein